MSNGISNPTAAEDTGSDLVALQLSRARLHAQNNNITNNSITSNNNDASIHVTVSTTPTAPTNQNFTAQTTNTNNTMNTNTNTAGGGGGGGGDGLKDPFSNFCNVSVDGDNGDREFVKCAGMIANIIRSRRAYKDCDKGEQEICPNEEGPKILSLLNSQQHYQSHDGDVGELLTMENGIFHFTGMKTKIVPWDTYIKDVRTVFSAIESGPCLSTAKTRLTTIAEKSHIYFLLNAEVEMDINKQMRENGVYAICARVDNAVHLPTCMTAQTLLDFIITTALEQPRTPLFYDENGKVVYLMEYLESYGVTDPRELTVQGLGLQPPNYRNKFEEYSILDANLNPSGKFGADLLQAIFSTCGPKEGDLFGSLIRSELERQEFKDRQVIGSEILLPLYGQNEKELYRLASWIKRQGFNSFQLNMWTLCIPRTFPLQGPNAQEVTCVTFDDQLRNIFYPMFMATLYPHDTLWADISALLSKTGSISIHTEKISHAPNFREFSFPKDIEYKNAIDDHYFFYYIWANIASLNALRFSLGMNLINFCPSVFEVAPAYDQLVSSFLLADVVYHVTSLEKSWIMQYLFMYCRIGIVMSPLRDNTLSMSYFDHPIVRYFTQGLKVSISTSDPLYFHHFHIPLLEEYATLMKLFSLLPMDIYELARNSVINSNFPLETKRKWLGEQFQPFTNQGNDIKRSGVSNSRLQFCNECVLHEENVLNLILFQSCKKGEEPNYITFLASLFSGGNALSGMEEQRGGGEKSSSLHPHPHPHPHHRLRCNKQKNYIDWRIMYPRIDVHNKIPMSVGNLDNQTKMRESIELLRNIISLRKKYVNSHVKGRDVNVEDVFNNYEFNEKKWEYNNYYGVFLLSRIGKSPPWPQFIPPIREFIRDVSTVKEVIINHHYLKHFCEQRLKILEKKFLLHLSLNISNESGAKEEKEWNNRDFFTAHKVDTNVQTYAGMNARTLLEFFVEKSFHHDHDVVFEEDNQPITLRQLLERYHIQANRITVDELNHLINSNTYIRNIFLEVDNLMKGRYFAELTKRTLELYQEDAFSFSENRLNIRGASKEEWWKLAHWFDRYGMASSQNRWMINLPRQYRRLKQEGIVKNFGEYIDNIFQPLWEISLHPAKDTKFHYFLTHVSGMDCIGDESKIDLPLTATYPHDWESDLNPPYNLYLYYYWANITSLNEFRASRGLGTFSFRPQCGELGDVEHLIGGFLLANSINHGVTLNQNPVLEYMYYITQIGVAMSPLSNTAAASPYLSNPFPCFFRRGLHVSLATNEPLYFHFTREPLIEEYSIAAKLWQFEFNDLSEIAKNSVLQSGFPSAWKENALGKLYYLNSPLGNDVRKSHVSDIRTAYRYEAYHSELNFLSEHLAAGKEMPRAMRQLAEEISIYEEVMQTTVVMLAAGEEGDNEREETRSPGARAVRLKAELEALERNMQQMKILTMHVANENRGIVEAFKRIRARLKTEGLTVMGNLTHYPPSSEAKEKIHAIQ